MCKEHRKEMYTLTAGTGEKLVFNRPNQKRIEKAGQLFFTLFKVQSFHISPVLPIFTPFWFSVFSLGFRSYSLGQGSAVRETGGKKNRREPKISASEANRAWVWGGVGWRPPPFPSPPLASLRSSIFFFFCWQSWCICLSSKHSLTFYSWLFTLYKNLKRPWLLTLLQAVKNSLSEIGSLRYERNKFERRPFGGSLVIFTPKKHQQ